MVVLRSESTPARVAWRQEEYLKSGAPKKIILKNVDASNSLAL